MPTIKTIPAHLKGITRFDVEFSDVEPINPLFSKCFIKVLYTGLNRNGVVIDKETAESMAQTLIGTPIVGEWIEKKEDFGTHGGIIEIKDDEINFIVTTKPFGFIPESSEIKWMEVTEEDGEVREYLTCTGILWTSRYPEAEEIIYQKRPQSMELHPETLEGYWGVQENQEVFHITHADFSALCILGSDIEPAFESASIEKYCISNPISFRKRFDTLIKEYKDSLGDKKVVNFSSADNKKDEGGSSMLQFTLNMDSDNIRYQLYNLLNPVSEDKREWKYSIATVDATNNNFIYVDETNDQAYIRTYTSSDSSGYCLDPEVKETKIVEYQEPKSEDNGKELGDLQKQYVELHQNYEELKEQVSKTDNSEFINKIQQLEDENKELKEFKTQVETQEKEEIIDRFSHLIDVEQLAPFKEKLDQFTKEQLEEKLSVIAIKRVDFTKSSIKDDLVPETNSTNISGVEKLIQKHNK